MSDTELASDHQNRHHVPSTSRQLREKDSGTRKLEYLKSKPSYYQYLVLPLLFLLMFGDIVKEAPFKQYLIKTVCDAYLKRTEPMGTTLVDPPNNTCAGIPEVQQMLAKISPLLQYASMIPSFVMAPLYGWASDKYGRKPVFLLICCGSILRHLSDLIALFLSLPYEFLLVGKFFFGVTGGNLALSSLMNSAVVDATTAETRISLFGAFQATYLLTLTFAEVLGGYLMKVTGDFTIPFILGCVFALLSLLYGIFILQETRIPHDGNDPGNSLDVLKLDLRKEVPWLTMLPFLIYWLGRESQNAIRAYYTNYRFGWIAWEESLFMAGNTLAAAAAMMFVLPLVDRTFRARFTQLKSKNHISATADETEPLLQASTQSSDPDTIVVIDDSSTPTPAAYEKLLNYLTMLSQAKLFTFIAGLHAFLFALANRSWILYALIPFAGIGSLGNAIEGALIAEMIHPDCLGLINTFVIQIDSLPLIIGSQLYAQIYQRTVGTRPETIFFVGGIMFVISTVTFHLVGWLKKR
ncbi:major facilitator superfamily domain-containing protein [Cladochytrium replicatum]|nr:major facilitator superfamily domain-containing protein [Cladochytrium replicatum]